MRYVPALDGLRGIAIILVVLFHTIDLPGGYLGVDVFFVLSGYLITRLFIVELEATGRIDLPRFFLRRALRLMPALWLVTGVTIGVAYLVHSPEVFRLDRWYWLIAVSYLTDLVEPRFPAGWLFTHTWSLSVEEQFYILWGLAAGLMLRRHRHRTALLMLAGVVAIYLWRAFLWSRGASHWRIENEFDTRADELLIGCALALLLSSPSAAARAARLLQAHPLASLLALASLCTFGSVGSSNAGHGALLWGPLLSTCTAVVIAEVVLNEQGAVARLLSNPTLIYIGTISYGLYLWHVPAYRLAIESGFDTAVERLAIGAGGGFLLASASYRYFERPILALKRRFSTAQASSL